MYCSNNPYITSIWDIFQLSLDEILKCEFTVRLLTFFICFCIAFGMNLAISSWICDEDDRHKQTVMFNLYSTQDGSHLCSDCKKKAGKYGGFIEEHQYTFKVKAGDFIRIKLFNDQHSLKNFYINKLARKNRQSNCLIIHDCGGLSLKFQILSEYPFHLLCLPSEHYNNVLVEETEHRWLNSKSLEECLVRTWKPPRFMERIIKFLYFDTDIIWTSLVARPKHYCNGSITFGKEEYIVERGSKVASNSTQRH